MKKKGGRTARYAAIVLLIAAIIGLSGCAPRAVELGDKLAAGVISVDYADGAYSVGVSCIDPRGGDMAQDAVELQFIAADGEFLDDAFEELDRLTGNRLFYGRSSGLVVSVSALEAKAAEIARYFIKDPNTRPRLYVFACEGEAARLIKLRTVDKTSTVSALQLIIDNADNAGYRTLPLFKLASALCDDGRRASAPLLAARKAETLKKEDEVFELYVAGEIGIEHEGGLMYNQMNNMS